MIIHLWGEFHISEILARREEGRSSTNLAVYLVEFSLLYCRSSPKCTSHLKPPSPSLGIAGAGGGEGVGREVGIITSFSQLVFPWEAG